ncbi:MAG: hypothetical protein HYY16_15695 [Planctomycetes bacterium]|nr:hypothetical protein [Planctomycetota bacterium]
MTRSDPSGRRRILAWSVAAIAAVWLIDRIFFTPWYEEMKRLRGEIEKARQQRAIAQATIQTRKSSVDEWKVLHERLARVPGSEARNDFVSGLEALSGLAGLQNWATKVGREQKIGDFIEYSVEGSFYATWEAFVRLLLEIHNWKDFLKVQRLSVTSKYEKENRLEVDLRVSTIEPAPARGAKP